MLCFIMALKSKLVSKDWECVSQLCENSLQSLYRQTDSDFKALLVCNETPILQGSYDNRIEIINLESPFQGRQPEEISYDERMNDKWVKVTAGMLRAGQLATDFIMIVDADDLVSNRLAEFANTRKDANGWILKTGYKYAYGSRWISVWDTYNCGTNAIVSSRLIQFPRSTTDDRDCIILKAGHTIIDKRLAELGTPLEPLPFRGGIQVVDHGDNATDLATQEWLSNHQQRSMFLKELKQAIGRNLRAAKKLKNRRYLSSKLRQEFSIPT